MVELKTSSKLKLKESGTTTVGLICKDAVVLAAEKKSTLGYLVASKESEKIIQLDDRIAMTMAGLSADGQALARYLKAEFKLYYIHHNRRIGLGAAAALLSNILQSSKYFPYYVQLIMAGYDDERGPSIFSFDAFGSYEEEKKYFSTGSGSPIALGVLEDSYKDGLSIDEGIDLAIRAIRSAIERDIASGGKAIDICVITKDGVKFSKYELK
jgi:proteasome beta subunit